MKNLIEGNNEIIKIDGNDIYCVIKNKEDNFCWYINLDDHPNSFLMKQSFQNFNPMNFQDEKESIVIIRPT